MRILLITSTYPTPARPRQGAFNKVMVDALSQNQEVQVIAPIPWSQSLPNYWADNANSRKTTVLHPTFYYPPKILRRYYGAFHWQSILPSIRKLETTFEPDLVMGYWLHPDGASAVRAAQRFGVPSIVFSGGTDLRVLSRQSERHGAITQVLEQANRVVLVSRELLSHTRRLGVPDSKVDVIYRGVDPSCFFPTDKATARTSCGLKHKAIVVLWAGRLEPVKNPEMLLNAAVSWKRTWGGRLQVIMVGDGAMRKQLLQLRRQLGLDDVVELLSSVSQNELAQYYNAADVTALTSYSEGIPNVLLESIACGTRFVATNVGGVAEIASPSVDRLVESEDVSTFAGAVQESVHASESAIPPERQFVPHDLRTMAQDLDTTIRHVVSTPLSSGCGLTVQQRNLTSPRFVGRS